MSPRVPTQRSRQHPSNIQISFPYMKRPRIQDGLPIFFYGGQFASFRYRQNPGSQISSCRVNLLARHPERGHSPCWKAKCCPEMLGTAAETGQVPKISGGSCVRRTSRTLSTVYSLQWPAYMDPSHIGHNQNTPPLKKMGCAYRRGFITQSKGGLGGYPGGSRRLSEKGGGPTLPLRVAILIGAPPDKTGSRAYPWGLAPTWTTVIRPASDGWRFLAPAPHA